MFWKRFLGVFGENTAAEFLKKQGFKILEKNYKCRFGEIDIIAKDGKTISFVEVKTITAGKTETPYDTINARKQEHISKSASFYLHTKELEDFTYRFDVVAIKYNKDKKPDIELIRDAF